MNKQEFISALLLMGFTDRCLHEDGHQDYDLYDPEHVGLLVCFVRIESLKCAVRGKQAYDIKNKLMWSLYYANPDREEEGWSGVLKVVTEYIENVRERNHE